MDQGAHVGRRVLVQLLVAAEDEDGDVDGAEDGELVGLLEEAAFPLEKSATRDRSARRLAQQGAGERARAYTERFLSSLIALISIFLRPILGQATGDGDGRQEGRRGARRGEATPGMVCVRGGGCPAKKKRTVGQPEAAAGWRRRRYTAAS